MPNKSRKNIPSATLEKSTADTEAAFFVMPATPAQGRFWLLHQMHAGNHALNMPVAWTCKGNFDPQQAAAALMALAHRHETLRTTFKVLDGQLSQVIHPTIEIGLPVEDLTSLPKQMRRERADAIIQEHAHIQMDLERGPLLFARAIRMEADEHILLVTIHHSVCDGWSNGILLRDFAAIYDGLMRRVPPGLPELPIQFGDFAVWLDEWRQSSKKAECLDYWRSALSGDIAPLRIQRDFPGGEGEELGDIETLLLSPDLAQKARDFCAARGVTLYMLLLSVYAATLNRLTGQGDFLIGTPCANRRPETEDLIGPFSNPQVIRIGMEKGDTLGSTMERVRSWAMGAIAHQDLPFEDLNDDEHFAHERNQLSLQVYFIYQKAFMKAQHTPSLDIVPLRSVSPGTMMDLILSIVERSEGTRLQLEYNPRFFRASTVQSVLRLYERTLETALVSPGSPATTSVSDRSEGQPATPSNGKFGSHLAALNATHEVLNTDVMAAEPEDGSLSRDYVAPRDALELQIAAIWEAAMGLKNLSVCDSFFDLGGQSLAALRIISRINKTYSLDFGLAVLFSGHTVELMAKLVGKRLAAHGDSSIVPMQPRGSAAPLFIIHGAGGNIIRFYQLAMLVGTDHPIYGIQAQSLLAGQRALLHLEDQAAYYLSEIRKIQPTGPYYFLGYSFGGTVALEIAHQLRAIGERVELLGMLDSRHRDCIAMTQRYDPMRLHLDRRITRFMGNLSSLSLWQKVGYLWDKLLTRSLRHYYKAAAALGLRSVSAHMKNADEISWVSAMNYRPQQWPGRITLFRTAVQPDSRLPMDLGWGPFAKSGVEIIDLPGDHDLIFRQPNIQSLAAQLRARFERTGSNHVVDDVSQSKAALHEPAGVAH